MNELQVYVDKSGLDTTKAKILLDRFHDYFDIAANWEVKAKSIVVKDASQVDDMKMARTGRLLLRERRIAIEKTRKELKEQSVREGKAIDGIANILKGLIVPLEKYLESQEKYVEIKAAEEAEKKRIEEELKAEEERIAAEKAERERQAKVQAENERLKREAIERERLNAEAKARLESERKAAEKKAQEAKARLESERKAAKENIAAERARFNREIECPYCHGKFVLNDELLRPKGV